MPSTIFQSDSAHTKIGGRLFDYCQNGNLFYADCGPTGTLTFYYSTNGGITWTAAATTLTDVLVGSLLNQSVGFFIDKDDYAHLLYNLGSDFAYRRGTPNSTRTDYTWSSSVSAATSGYGHGYGGIDIVAHREGTGWVAHCIMGENEPGTGNGVVTWVTMTITSGGAISKGTRQDVAGWGYNVGSNVSVDFHHETADPKAVQGSAPHVYIASTTDDSNVYTYVTRLAYSAGSWTVGSQQTVNTGDWTYYINPPQLFYDGTRIVVVYTFVGSYATLRCFERDEANTTTTTRSVTSTGGGYGGGLYSYGCGYDNDQNIWVFVSEDTSGDFLKSRYLRSGGTWGTWSVVETSTGLSEYRLCSVARGIQPLATTRNQLGVVYPQRDTSPDSIKYDTLTAGVVFEAVLQGVGTMTPDPKLAISVAQTTVQGVGTLSAITAAVMRPDVTLQGVGTLVPKAVITPSLDFTKYDGYLDSDSLGGPFGLIYHEDEQAKAQTVSRQLRPARTDDGMRPTEVRPEAGEIFSQQEFSQGAGQLFAHREGADVKRYLWSEGFDADIDTAGEPSLLKHLRDVVGATVTFDWSPSSYIGKLEIFNSLLFVSSGQTISSTADVTSFWTSEDPMAAEGNSDIGVADLASSGQYLYAACGSRGIHRRDTTGAWSHWSDIPAVRVAWVKNRIVGASPTAIYEVISGGVVPTALETLPSGWTWTSIWEAAGFIYATAISPSSGLSRVHAYGLNSDLSALEKKSETPAPRDQILRVGKGYLGTVYLGGGLKNSDGGYDPVLYQSVPGDDGSLSYAKVVEGEGAGAIDLSILAMEPVGENMVFGYTLGGGFAYGARDGLGIHKLKNSAFLPWVKKNGAGAGRSVRGLTTFNGRLVFVLANDGVYYEDVTKYVLDAYLISSVADWQTTSKKAWDLFQVSSNPLPSGAVVRLDYTTKLPSAGEWTNVIVESTAGDTLEEARTPELISRLLAVRIRSTAAAGQLVAPSGHGFLVRSNLLPDVPEYSLVRFVRLLNRDRKDEQGPEVFIDPQTIRETIQNLAYRWITLYEPGVIWTARVDQISEIQPFLEDYDQARGEWNRQAYIMQMVMSGTRD